MVDVKLQANNRATGNGGASLHYSSVSRDIRAVPEDASRKIKNTAELCLWQVPRKSSPKVIRESVTCQQSVTSYIVTDFVRSRAVPMAGAPEEQADAHESG